MTPEHRAIILLAAMAALFIVYQWGLKQVRCGYCGAVNTHEPHCPYANTGARMR